MTINLLLKCEDLGATRAFCARILGFDVSDSANGTCTVRKSGGTIIFTIEDLWEGLLHCTGTIYFFVPDIDEYYNAIKDKANVRWPLQNMAYGTREFAAWTATATRWRSRSGCSGAFRSRIGKFPVLGD